MKITAEDVAWVLRDKIFIGFMDREDLQIIANRFNIIVEEENIHVSTKDLFEAEGQLRLF